MIYEILIKYLVFAPFLAGILAYALDRIDKKGKAKDIFVILFTLAEFVLILYLAGGVLFRNGEWLMFGESLGTEVPGICGFGFQFVVDGFRAVYISIAGFMWAMVSLLSLEYFLHHRNVGRFYMFLLWTLGATLGVFLSADLMTTFIFFEMMSFTSYVWVAQEENRPSLRAAETYLGVAVIGGLVMLMGIFLLYHRTGILNIDQLILLDSSDPYLFASGLCILVGFGAKAGAFPLHIWLPKAHPVAPAPASALLSGILTKTGIYGTLLLSCRMFFHNGTWGMLILVLGTVTMFTGALLALFSIDLKRTLACSSMSQIGFIMVGIGMQGLLKEENELALHGSFLHMINHSLIKLVLFMVAGVIYANLHALNLNEIRGYGRNKGRLMLFFLTGALAIGGIPGFSGYVSKTLLHESIVEYHGGPLFTVIEWVFLISGGMTVCYMTKLFVAIFVEKNKNSALQRKYNEKKNYMKVTGYAALLASSSVLFAFGLFPHAIMERVAILGEPFLAGYFVERHQVEYFHLENVKGALISISIGAVLYLFVVRKFLMKNGEYVDRLPKWMDLENLIYRPILLGFLPFVCRLLCRIFDSALDTIVVILRKTLYKDSPLPHERMEGSMISDFFGNMANRHQHFVNDMFPERKKDEKDYVHLYALKRLEIKESHFIIQRSLSFGLLLFCIGLGFALVYIILL